MTVLGSTPDGPPQPVRIVGVGLIGTSIGLACSRAGLDVQLVDRDADQVRTASGLGAGRPAPTDGGSPGLVVVCVPPDHLSEAIEEALETGACVTDVGSVKAAPAAALAGHPQRARYVGSHPMAGSERSGPLAGSADLFAGRPWALTPHPDSGAEAVAAVRALIEVCRGVAVELTPAEHDLAVARTSHVPHLVASLTAGTLADAPPSHVSLAGQGVRDVTRVAAGDPGLYGQIVGWNAEAITEVLTNVRDRMSDVIDLLARPGGVNRNELEAVLAQGVAGTRAIPAKHGEPSREMAWLAVAVPDRPGELARLFADADSAGVNIEDVRIDHDPHRSFGQVELWVDAGSAATFADALTARDWDVRR